MKLKIQVHLMHQVEICVAVQFKMLCQSKYDCRLSVKSLSDVWGLRLQM